MFKIALTAGHYLGTPGKRCMQALDPGQTREWILNDRIADRVEQLLKHYTGYALLRTDDTTGEQEVTLYQRAKAANDWNADFYLSIHHNAGINGGAGGGIVVYVYTRASEESRQWQKALYEELVRQTGLRGDRVSPLAAADLYECRQTKMPAVLLELGFMDSSTDVPVILTEEYAEQCAQAIVQVLVKRGGLKERPREAAYQVTVGSYPTREQAQQVEQALQTLGLKARTEVTE